MAEDQAIFEATTEVVAAFVQNNRIQADRLPELILAVSSAFRDLLAPPPAPEPIKLSSARIRSSITPDALISFVDGQPYRTLKRHLAKHGLTPASYREKYGLPADYPMTAAAYSELRSKHAKAIGLGARGRPSRKKRSR